MCQFVIVHLLEPRTPEYILQPLLSPHLLPNFFVPSATSAAGGVVHPLRLFEQDRNSFDMCKIRHRTNVPGLAACQEHQPSWPSVVITRYNAPANSTSAEWNKNTRNTMQLWDRSFGRKAATECVDLREYLSHLLHYTFTFPFFCCDGDNQLAHRLTPFSTFVGTKRTNAKSNGDFFVPASGLRFCKWPRKRSNAV